MFRYFIALVFALCVISGVSGQSRVSEPETASVCTLKLEQAPEVRGFKLGMTIAQVKTQYPRLEVPKPNKYGLAQLLLEFVPSDLSMRKGMVTLENSTLVSTHNYPEFQGLRYATFRFFDDKIYFIELQYDGKTKWRDIDEFAERISISLKLPREWEEMQESEEQLLIRCQGFRVIVKLENPTTPLLHLSDPLPILLLKERRAESENKKRDTFKP